MKLPYLILQLLLLTASSSIRAQTTYDPGKLKFRYQSYKGLMFGTSLNQRGATSNNLNFGNSDNLIQFDGYLTYFAFVNTNTKQCTTHAGIDLHPSYRTLGNLRIPGITSNISYGTVYKAYNENNNFIGFELSLFDDLYSQKKTTNSAANSLVSDLFQYNNTSSGYFTLGKGRAEYISDGVNAIRLFDELRLKQLLLREVNSEDITGLTNIIIHFNNTRVLDNRTNKIAMIEAMINFLKAGKLINEGDASTFAILNDQVYFAVTISRFSGVVRQLAAGAQMSNHSWRLKTDSNIVKNLSINVTPKVAFSRTRYKVVNLKKQINNGIEIGIADVISNLDYVNGNSTQRTRTPQLLLTAFYEQGYYPNTRTYLTWTNRMSLLKGMVYMPTSLQYISTAESISSGVTLYYYFSPQLRIMVNENLSGGFTEAHYKNGISNSNTTLSNYLDAGFTYSLY